ncbi:acid protease [Tilletiaria anomala UBC 951]|uniref:Acid protease n=1 Tax=Tilletiaria anomala (strain ATCC 24038 / CBS 436.72 / UBC 951) TaxID=1037660 RepID=A0A066W768_TILAU|nr:acid protease [Tilletiaria anomala UBC 951]KDN46640.1 acid protease [Tilletiaria anomala UBC 951]
MVSDKRLTEHRRPRRRPLDHPAWQARQANQGGGGSSANPGGQGSTTRSPATGASTDTRSSIQTDAVGGGASTKGTATTTGPRTGASTSPAAATASSSSTATAHGVAGSPNPGSGDDSAAGGSANGILTDPSSYRNTSRIVLSHLGGGGQLIYTMPISINHQTLNLQVDTGSSDLWVASTGCRSDSCSSTSSSKVQLFDSRDAPNLNIRFDIQYVQGGVSGSIVTSNVLVPGTDLTLVRQALGSASTVTNEPLGAGNFTGIVGLGLPLASELQRLLYDNTGNSNPGNDVSDASSTGSILTGIWSGRPLGARYIGVGLQRLPSEGGVGDSTLTISSLDPTYATNMSQLTFDKVPSTPASGSDSGDGSSSRSISSAAHWRTYLTQMTIDVGGNTVPLSLGGSMGTQYPLATFSTGTPFSLAPTSVLNQVYGAYGYQPGSDGGYYVPCDLMMNFTLYLGTSSVQVPIHPLDANIHQTSGDPNYCFGGFQAIDQGVVGGVQKLGADFVIGAPFMRSVFSVFSCDDLVHKPTNETSDICDPQIGIRPLITDPKFARDQFYQVRVLKQSLGADPVSTTANPSGLTSGLQALIGVLSGIAGIAGIMVLVVLYLKRQRKKRHALAIASGAEKEGTSRSPSLDEAAIWSDAQLAKAREVHRMHGVFDEDDVMHAHNQGGLAAAQRADFGANSTGHGVGGSSSLGVLSASTPYQDARRIKQAYLNRHPSFELKSRDEQAQILSALSQQDGQSAHEFESMTEEEDNAVAVAAGALAAGGGGVAMSTALPQVAEKEMPQPQPPLAEASSNYAHSSHMTNPSGGSSAYLLGTPQFEAEPVPAHRQHEPQQGSSEAFQPEQHQQQQEAPAPALVPAVAAAERQDYRSEPEATPYRDYPYAQQRPPRAPSNFHFQSQHETREQNNQYPHETTAFLAPAHRAYPPQQPLWAGNSEPMQSYPHQHANFGFLAPAAEVRMQPTFHHGASPTATPQRSTDDLDPHAV